MFFGLESIIFDTVDDRKKTHQLDELVKANKWEDRNLQLAVAHLLETSSEIEIFTKHTQTFKSLYKPLNLVNCLVKHGKKENAIYLFDCILRKINKSFDWKALSDSEGIYELFSNEQINHELFKLLQKHNEIDFHLTHQVGHIMECLGFYDEAQYYFTKEIQEGRKNKSCLDKLLKTYFTNNSKFTYSICYLFDHTKENLKQLPDWDLYEDYKVTYKTEPIELYLFKKFYLNRQYDYALEQYWKLKHNQNEHYLDTYFPNLAYLRITNQDIKVDNSHEFYQLMKTQINTKGIYRKNLLHLKIYDDYNQFDFGKYKGNSICSILDSNEYSYIEWCIENVTSFALNPKLTLDYASQISHRALEINLVKYIFMDEVKQEWGNIRRRIAIKRQRQYDEDAEDRAIRRERDRDNFDALTDGQYGNFEDWDGDFDNLYDKIGF